MLKWKGQQGDVVTLIKRGLCFFFFLHCEYCEDVFHGAKFKNAAAPHFKAPTNKLHSCFHQSTLRELSSNIGALRVGCAVVRVERGSSRNSVRIKL